MVLRCTGRFTILCISLVAAVALKAGAAHAQEYRTFESEKFGFTMEYPATWVKIDKPKGNYYVVFQAPNLTDKFRNRIHVAAHEPVKDPLDVFLQEMRSGIKDLQKKTKKKGRQEVRILDEGKFACEVPGAYFFFIQALEDKLNIWMDIVIVFYKHEDTLLRVSCLAPSSYMEKMHGIFNHVLVSVRFPEELEGEGAPQASEVAPSPSSKPSAPAPQSPPQPTAPSPGANFGSSQPAPGEEPPPPPRGPVGPSRRPGGPSTGIVE